MEETFEEFLNKIKSEYEKCVDSEGNINHSAKFKLYETRVLTSGKLDDMIKFLKKFTAVDEDAFARKILESNSPYANYEYMKARPNADLQKHKDVIKNSGSAVFCYRTARDFGGEDVSDYEQVVINSGDIRIIVDFARDIVGANIANLSDVVLRNGDVVSNSKFITIVTDEERKQKHLDVVLSKGTAEELYDCAVSNRLYASQLEQALLDKKSPFYSYKFARDIPGADKDAHEAIVMSLGNDYTKKSFKTSVRFIYEPSIEGRFFAK